MEGISKPMVQGGPGGFRRLTARSPNSHRNSHEAPWEKHALKREREKESENERIVRDGRARRDHHHHHHYYEYL